MPRLSRTAIGLIVFLAWTIIGFYFATQAYYNPAFIPRLPWSQAIAINLTYYYLWGLCTPLVIFLGRRFRFDGGRWLAALVAHVIGSAALTAAQIVIAESFLAALGLASRVGSI